MQVRCDLQHPWRELIVGIRKTRRAVSISGVVRVYVALKPAVIGYAALNYSLEERDYLIRTMAFEAPGEPDVGKAAVAHVILNRKKTHRWGDTVKDVVMKPWQFEPWMTRRKEMENLSPDDPRYRKAGRIADAVLAGDVPDPTAGATHFINPKIVRQRRGGSLPSWAQGEGVSIGRHTFYSPDEATDDRPGTPTFLMSWMFR